MKRIMVLTGALLLAAAAMAQDTGVVLREWKYGYNPRGSMLWTIQSGSMARRVRMVEGSI